MVKQPDEQNVWRIVWISLITFGIQVGWDEKDVDELIKFWSNLQAYGWVYSVLQTPFLVENDEGISFTDFDTVWHDGVKESLVFKVT